MFHLEVVNVPLQNDPGSYAIQFGPIENHQLPEKYALPN